MNTLKQETRPGTQRLEEVRTLDLLERLTPRKRGQCRSGTKPVGSACVKQERTYSVVLDSRIGLSLTRAADYVHTLPLLVEEVVQTGRAVTRRIQ